MRIDRLCVSATLGCVLDVRNFQNPFTLCLMWRQGSGATIACIMICEEMRQFIAKFSHTNHLSGGIQPATQCMIPILTISQITVSLIIFKMLIEM